MSSDERPGRKGGSNVHLSGKLEHEMFAQQQQRHKQQKQQIPPATLGSANYEN